MILEFLKDGRLGPLRVGSLFTDVVGLPGEPADIGTGPAKWQMAAYCDRHLQVSYQENVVGLIGIYFHREDEFSPVLPAALNCEVPFTGRTTRPELIAYLEVHGITWKPEERLPDSDSILIPGGVSTNFGEDGFLRSLLASES
jgi:hypothetical protein